jgi:hypothetical protein
VDPKKGKEDDKDKLEEREDGVQENAAQAMTTPMGVDGAEEDVQVSNVVGPTVVVGAAAAATTTVAAHVDAVTNDMMDNQDLFFFISSSTSFIIVITDDALPAKGLVGSSFLTHEPT